MKKGLALNPTSIFFQMYSQEKLYQLALLLSEGVGDIIIRQLLSFCGSAESVYQSNLGKLVKIPGIQEITARKILNKNNLILAEKQLQIAEKEKIKLLFYLDEQYPERLKRNYDSPAMIYYKGNIDLNQSKIIGIVGTRNATDYGKRITDEIVNNFQNHQTLIVSGLAYGIDIAAHKASLKYQLPTVGVLASGLDFMYPASHKKTADLMCQNGGILSEHSFGRKPDPRYFPARNRIIAGMSDALIVVEAAAKGGALITAEYANNYHKEVFAVPGNLGSLSSEGCNALIKNNKAQIYTSANDIIEALNWDLENKTSVKKPVQAQFDLTQFTDDEAQVLSIIREKGEIQIDELAWISQLHMNKLASLLLNLEFQGIVKSMAGKKYGLC
ncbi:MAG: DNA-processing protein DprA [Bacteroidota bacterium]